MQNTTILNTKGYSKLILSVTSDNYESFWILYEFWDNESLKEPFYSGIKKYLSREDIHTSPILIYMDSNNNNPFKDILESIINTEIKYPLFDNSWVEYCNDFLIMQVYLTRRSH